MHRVLIVLVVLAAALAAQPCAVGVSVPDSDATQGTCNVFPFGQPAFTYVSRVSASYMSVANPYVEDIAFAPCFSGAFVPTDIVIALGHIPNPLPAAFTFPTFDASGVLINAGSFLDLTIIHNSYTTGSVGPASTTGPFNWPVTQDTWSPMGFSATAGTGFLWNGVDDVGFFVTHQGSTGGAFHRATEPRIYTAAFNAASCSTCNAASALKIQLLVSQGPGLGAVPDWQCNQASASLDVNGAPDPGPSVPMRTSVGTGVSVTANFGGLAGMPFDVGWTLTPGRPVGGGGFLTPGGQAVNIDFSTPTLQFVFGFQMVNSFAPYSQMLSSSIPVFASGQMVVIDPALTDGFALSHLNELEFLTCGVTEDFDSLPNGVGVAPIGWVNPSGTAMPWTVDSSGTPSSGTGPTAAFNGSNYIYCETSGAGANSTFIFDTCPVDSTTLTTATLTFELSAIGATIGTLNIYQGDGAGNYIPLPIFTQTGAEPGQSQGGVEWTNKSVPFSPLTPFIDFRFEYLSGTSFTGDLAIDDIILN